MRPRHRRGIDQPRRLSAIRQVRRDHMYVVPKLGGKLGEPFSARAVERHCGAAGMQARAQWRRQCLRWRR